MNGKKIGKFVYAFAIVGSIAFGSAQAFSPQAKPQMLDNGCELCFGCHPILGGKTEGTGTGICLYCCQVP